MKSRSGIYYTLADSPYSVTEQVNEAVIEYRFSSAKHQEAFCTQTVSLVNRYDFKTAFYLLETFRIYRRIETRGFYAIVNGEVITCPDQLIFTDRVLTPLSGEQ